MSEKFSTQPCAPETTMKRVLFVVTVVLLSAFWLWSVRTLYVRYDKPAAGVTSQPPAAARPSGEQVAPAPQREKQMMQPCPYVQTTSEDSWDFVGSPKITTGFRFSKIGREFPRECRHWLSLRVR